MRIAIPLTAAAIAMTACAVEDQPSPGDRPTESAASSASQAPGGQQNPAKESVEIADFTFKPGDLTVAVGSMVTWTQQDTSTHTVDFDDGEKSGDMAKGDTYSRTFDKPGEYPYICFYHPRMKATITVE